MIVACHHALTSLIDHHTAITLPCAIHRETYDCSVQLLPVSEKEVDTEEELISGACLPGKILHVKDGNGDRIRRSEFVNCAMGSYYDLSLRDCQPCAVGSYQDNEGEEFCKLCPQGKTNRETGAKSQDMCLDTCSSGEFSDSGLATCNACPLGTYQPCNRSTHAQMGLVPKLSAPNLWKTAKGISFLAEICAAGSYSPQGVGGCLPCCQGTYQPNSKAKSSIQCPPGTTTVKAGSTSASQCYQGECGMDFENGLGGWKRTGTAFDNQPTYGDNSLVRNGQNAEMNGDYWIGGYKNRPTPSGTPGATQGDGPQRSLTSPPFRIGGTKISYLVGGGCDASKERVELLIDGSVVMFDSGQCTETMRRVEKDVSAYVEKMARMRIPDDSSEGWGHINFDDLRGNFCIQFS
ncbi:signal peptide, CUB and EGF-like domain-containing protein 2 [Nematostella vectensis]|uniref:signal peptide, CUB and EGF-like domain-containing protein 2 n=1 Tax=Nematostella vectensis TaxID=45351 RepID=UPI0020770602|nr:signal peptide, CUB and EGF-like domain-containing protein 2 [Nematostella vectensis]